MFCSNCGKILADDAKFCDVCGAQISVTANVAANTATASVPAQSSPIFSDFLKVIKGFFSKNTVKTVGDSAKSTGMEWLLIAAVSVLTYAFALAINVKQILDSVLGSLSGMLSATLYNFGSWLLYGLLISACTYFLISILIFAVMKLIFKKNVNIKCVFNLVATASLPLACAYILGIILGFIWVPFVFIFSVTAIIATATLLYAGIQKLDKLESSPFIAYTGIWAVVITVILIIVSIVANTALENAIGNAIGSLGSAIGSLGGLLG